jgi:F-type H+-transporting ATPase subunit delta
MKDTRVASRYALSLFDLAIENNILDAVSEDMKLILSVIEDNREFAALLKSPLVKADKKSEIFKEVFGKKVSAPTLKLLELVASKRREESLDLIANEFLTLVNEHKGIQKVIVTTAIGLDSKLRSEVLNIIKKSTDSEIELVEKIDKSIIGGFILKIGDQNIDSSIARSIKKLRRNFSENPYNKEL